MPQVITNSKSVQLVIEQISTQTQELSPAGVSITLEPGASCSIKEVLGAEIRIMEMPAWIEMQKQANLKNES